MHSTRRLIWALVLILPLLSGSALPAVPLNVPGDNIQNIDIDDYVPDVTDRVARISFIRGDVRIRRSGSQDWERATLNLPLVAGDEIASDQNARCELQFDIYTHVRLDENSVIKVSALSESGIALSVPQGTATARLSNFDKDRTYFEIDAPNTTIAVEKSGTYRVDAGQAGSVEIRVTATDDGQARIYSDNAGFTLRSGRSATIAIAGAYAGEMQMADADGNRDDFDKWSRERDAVIAKRLRDAYYDKYYDRDIYGAEDLNDFGDWVYTQDYGYVWSPSPSSTSVYSGWSPYRYGSWRWVGPYGWTWVGDEPWGWATYHYGRWVWAGGRWVWSPYGYYRYSRSWWQPAYVIISVIDNNICWYPLPYRRHNRDNYNSHHHGGGPRGNQNGGHPNPTPTPTPPVGQTPPIEERRRPRTPPLSQTPPTAVVSVPASEFGRGRNFRTPPLAVATTVISQTPDIIVAPPVLPSYKELGGRVSKEIVAETPPILAGTDRRVVRTGAAERKADAPLDNELRSRRIFGDRAPLAVPAGTEPRRVDPAQPSEPRRTGAVERRPIIKSEPDNDTPIIEQPTRREQRKFEPTPTKRDDAPTYVPPTRENPRQEPPMRRESPKYEPPPRQETPKYEPPTRQESPKSDPPPRNDPPPTRNDSPPKSDPPPQKSDGPVDRKGKDGRGR